MFKTVVDDDRKSLFFRCHTDEQDVQLMNDREVVAMFVQPHKQQNKQVDQSKPSCSVQVDQSKPSCSVQVDQSKPSCSVQVDQSKPQCSVQIVHRKSTFCTSRLVCFLN